jgi:hypothetical protein
MEQLTDKSLFILYQDTIQLNKEEKISEDFIKLLEVEISKRGLPLKER